MESCIDAMHLRFLPKFSRALLCCVVAVSFSFRTDNVYADEERGDGIFLTPVQYQTGGRFPRIVQGNFNNDGLTDLAVASSETSSKTEGQLMIFNGEADGGFVLGGDLVLGDETNSMTANDFNNDGLTDLAIDRVLPPGIGTLLINGGNESFTQSELMVGFHEIYSEDLDGDGFADLIFTGSDVSAIYGQGNAEFGESEQLFSIGSLHTSLAFVDLDGDQDLDMVSANYFGLSISLQNRGGLFIPQVPNVVESNAALVALADFDGDGVHDIVAVLRELPDDDSVVVIFGNGDGTFGQSQTLTVGSDFTSIATSDFDGDGFVDIAISNEGAESILFGQATATRHLPLWRSIGLVECRAILLSMTIITMAKWILLSPIKAM